MSKIREWWRDVQAQAEELELEADPPKESRFWWVGPSVILFTFGLWFPVLGPILLFDQVFRPGWFLPCK